MRISEDSCRRLLLLLQALLVVPLLLFSAVLADTSVNDVLLEDPQTCITNLKLSDVDHLRDILSKHEYLLFVNHYRRQIASSSNVGNLKPFAHLPSELEQVFTELSEGGEMNIYGVRPGQVMTEHEEAFVESICRKTITTLQQIMAPVAIDDIAASSSAFQPESVMQEEEEVEEETAPSCSYTVALDISIQFEGEEIDCSSEVEQSIVDRVDLVTSFSGYKKKADFGPFQLGACPEIPKDCSSSEDKCLSGCLTATNDSCETDWDRLSDDVRVKLASMNAECLGISQTLKVTMTIVENETETIQTKQAEEVEQTDAPSEGAEGEEIEDNNDTEVEENVDDMLDLEADGEETVPCQTEFTIGLDVQIRFVEEGIFAGCMFDEEENIVSTIQTAIWEASYTDWELAEFNFDIDEEVNNANPFAFMHLQEAACPPRTIECDEETSDYCRWGCFTGLLSSCEGSPDDWADSLAEDIRGKLIELGYDCLGLPDELYVYVESDAQGTPIVMEGNFDEESDISSQESTANPTLVDDESDANSTDTTSTQEEAGNDELEEEDETLQQDIENTDDDEQDLEEEDESAELDLEDTDINSDEPLNEETEVPEEIWSDSPTMIPEFNNETEVVGNETLAPNNATSLPSNGTGVESNDGDIEEIDVDDEADNFVPTASPLIPQEPADDTVTISTAFVVSLNEALTMDSPDLSILNEAFKLFVEEILNQVADQQKAERRRLRFATRRLVTLDANSVEIYAVDDTTCPTGDVARFLQLDSTMSPSDTASEEPNEMETRSPTTETEEDIDTQTIAPTETEQVGSDGPTDFQTESPSILSAEELGDSNQTEAPSLEEETTPNPEEFSSTGWPTMPPTVATDAPSSLNTQNSVSDPTSPESTVGEAICQKLSAKYDLILEEGEDEDEVRARFANVTTAFMEKGSLQDALEQVDPNSRFTVLGSSSEPPQTQPPKPDNTGTANDVNNTGTTNDVNNTSSRPDTVDGDEDGDDGNSMLPIFAGGIGAAVLICCCGWVFIYIQKRKRQVENDQEGKKLVDHDVEKGEQEEPREEQNGNDKTFLEDENSVDSEHEASGVDKDMTTVAPLDATKEVEDAAKSQETPPELTAAETGVDLESTQNKNAEQFQEEPVDDSGSVNSDESDGFDPDSSTYEAVPTEASITDGTGATTETFENEKGVEEDSRPTEGEVSPIVDADENPCPISQDEVPESAATDDVEAVGNGIDEEKNELPPNSSAHEKSESPEASVVSGEPFPSEEQSPDESTSKEGEKDNNDSQESASKTSSEEHGKNAEDETPLEKGESAEEALEEGKNDDAAAPSISPLAESENEDPESTTVSAPEEERPSEDTSPDDVVGEQEMTDKAEVDADVKVDVDTEPTLVEESPMEEQPDALQEQEQEGSDEAKTEGKADAKSDATSAEENPDCVEDYEQEDPDEVMAEKNVDVENKRTSVEETEKGSTADEKASDMPQPEQQTTAGDNQNSEDDADNDDDSAPPSNEASPNDAVLRTLSSTGTDRSVLESMFSPEDVARVLDGATPNAAAAASAPADTSTGKKDDSASDNASSDDDSSEDSDDGDLT